MLRNLGVAFSYNLQAIAALQKGLGRVGINAEKLDQELEEHYELLAEPVQTVMRKFDIPNPYEKLKDFTRGKAQVSKADFVEFIENLEGLPAEEKESLKQLTPSTYTGLASTLAKNVKQYWE